MTIKNKIVFPTFLCFVSIFTCTIFQTKSAVADGNTNLITNSSLETASTSPASVPFSWYKGGYGTNNRSLTYPVIGREDTKAAKTEITSYTNGDAKWYFQPVSVSGGQQFTFSDYYKSTAISYVTIQYQLENGNFKYIDIATSLPATSTWVQITKTFTVPTNYASPVVNMTVFHLIKSIGWIITDDYSLQDTSRDTAPPSVYIGDIGSQPLSGTITLSASTTDNVGVAGVQFIVDNTAIENEDLVAPYSILWDTQTIPDGTHTLLAIARDTSGNMATSAPVQINILNHPAPTTGTVIIKKHVINDNGGSLTAERFNLHLTEGSGTTTDILGSPFNGNELGTSFILPSGIYTVREDFETGYSQVNFSGDCDSQGILTVAAGTTTTCTITNDDIPPPAQPGTIEVNVVVINNNDGTKGVEDFAPAIDTQGVTSGTEITLPAGVHIISETIDPNYTTTISGDCDPQGNVTLAGGDKKICTITNDDIPPVPPIPTNLILNPSVENVSTNTPSLPLNWYKGGYGINTRSLTYTNESQDGVKGMKTEITSYTSGDAKWYFQPVSVSGGQQLTYSEYYKSNIQSEIDIQYQLQDGTFRYAVLTSNLPESSDWTQASFIFTVPQTYISPVVSMTVFHIIDSVGWVQTDNYSISTYTPPPADPNNSILNPSVEISSGTFSSFPAFWSHSSSEGTTASFTYPVSGMSSSRALQIDVTNYTGGAGAKWYFQSVPVTPGDDYVFSDYFKSTTQSYLSIQFLMNDGTYTYLDLTPLATSTEWKQSNNTFTVPPNAVSLTILHIIKGVGRLTTDSYVLKKLPSGAFPSGMVSLNFDDSLESIYQNAMPILNNAGIKSTQYVITQALENPGYWTTSQLSEIATAGHEIGAHTRTHSHLPTLNSTDLINEIAGSKSDLLNLGYTATTFSYPYGDYNDVVVQEVKDAGFKGARSVHSGFNTKNTNPYALNDQHIEANTTIEQIKSWIDQAVSTKTWLILELHDIDHSGVQYSTTPEILQQIVDYIQQTNIPVIDNTEGLTMITN